MGKKALVDIMTCTEAVCGKSNDNLVAFADTQAIRPPHCQGGLMRHYESKLYVHASDEMMREMVGKRCKVTVEVWDDGDEM